jgi:hypothetical protein
VAKTSKQYEVKRAEPGAVVALRSAWARHLGPVPALWLCQALFTQNLKGDGEWWYKSRCAQYDEAGRMLPPKSRSEQSFEYETGLSRSQQEKARVILTALGIVFEKLQGIPRRLYYLIDTARLSQLSKEWEADTACTVGRTVQKITAPLTVESARTAGKVGQASTETSQRPNLESSSRSSAVRKHLGFADHPKVVSDSNVRKSYVGGILCWKADDREVANSLIAKFGVQKIADVVKKIEDGGQRPFPSLVEKELCRPKNSNEIEMTRLRMEKYVDTNEMETRELREVQKTIDGLSNGRREELKCIFLAENVAMRSKSLDHPAGKMIDLAEGLLFKRWLEVRFRNGAARG